jgi:hypothetical protein
MRKNGLVGIIDRTPDLPGRSRGEEIAAWLVARPDVEAYAITSQQQSPRRRAPSVPFR